MKVVYKYPIVFEHEQSIFLPVDLKPLSVQLQDDVFCLWALTDGESQLRFRQLWIIGTGHKEVEDNAEWIGTVQKGSYVWHFFLGPLI